MIYKLGPWEFNTSTNKLDDKQSNLKRHISPKAAAVLILLLENPDTVYSIDLLIDEAWDGRVVSDHAIYKIINELRKTLAPEDKNAFIINIPKKGYKLNDKLAIDVLSSISQKQNDLNHANDTNIQSKTPPTQSISKSQLWIISLSIAAVLLTYLFSSLFNNKLTIQQYTNITPVTTSLGDEINPQFSTDGKYLIYSREEPNNENTLSPKKRPINLYLVNLDTDQERQITDNLYTETGAVLSDDAKVIIFIRKDKNSCNVILLEERGDLAYEEKILFACLSNDIDLAINSDGSTLYYTQATPPHLQHNVFSYTVLTGKTLQLTKIDHNNSHGDRKIALSPDNKKLAFLRDINAGSTSIGVINLEDMTEKHVRMLSGWIDNLSWGNNSETILYQTGNNALTAISTKHSQDKKITSDFTKTIQDFSFNRKTQDIFISFGSKQNMLRLTDNSLAIDNNAAPQNKDIIQSTVVVFWPQFANTSNRLAYMSTRTGSPQIWIQEENGIHRRLTSYDDGRSVRTIQWSPDDRLILSETEDQSEIFTINVETGLITTLAESQQLGPIGGPTWSMDGKGIFFASDLSGDSQIYYKSLDEQKLATPITKTGGNIAFASRTDANILYIIKPHKAGLWEYNIQTENERRIIEGVGNSIHRSINITADGIFYALFDEPIKFFNFSTEETVTINENLIPFVPVLSLSHNEKVFVYPHVEKNESSIYKLSSSAALNNSSNN